MTIQARGRNLGKPWATGFCAAEKSQALQGKIMAMSSEAKPAPDQRSLASGR